MCVFEFCQLPPQDSVNEVLIMDVYILLMDYLLLYQPTLKLTNRLTLRVDSMKIYNFILRTGITHLARSILSHCKTV